MLLMMAVHTVAASAPPLGCAVKPNGSVMQALAADTVHQNVHLIA
jgi:hypothetical protein